METKIDNKKFIIKTDAGYYYNQDKTKKTADLETALSWFGLTKEDNDKYATVEPNSYWFSGLLIEPDDEPDTHRVKISYWKVKNSRPTEDGELKVVKCVNDKTGHDHFYLYSNGDVSGEDANGDAELQAKLDKRHRIKSMPSPCATEWYDYAQVMADMNAPDIHRNSCGSGETFCDETMTILKEAGFPTRFWTSWGRGIALDSYDDLIMWCQTAKPKKATKECEDITKDFTPLGEDEIVRIEKVPNGVMFRCKANGEYKPDDGRLIENARVFVTKRGTVSQTFLKPVVNEEGVREEVWTQSNSKSTGWFYHLMNKADVNVDDLKDLVVDNPKFQYINGWINDNIKHLLGIHDEIKELYIYSGLIEFLRFANQNPVFVDTIIKLGYADEMFYGKNSIKVDANGERAHYNYNYTTRTYEYSEGTREVEYKYFSADDFKKNSTPYCTLRKSDKFYGTLDINKGQWKLIMSKGDTLDKKLDCLCCLDFMQGYFTGKGTTFDKEHYWYQHNVKDHTWAYESVADVPMNEFERVFNLWYEYAFNPAKYNRWHSTYGGRNFSACCLNDTYRLADMLDRPVEEILGVPTSDDKFKLLEQCAKKGVDYWELEDYHNMRRDCLVHDLIDAEDWPLIPSKVEYIKLFHDRLIELYNAHQNEIREKEEAKNQLMYEERIKNEKLEKFEYEEEDDERAMVIPKKLIDLVTDGQRNSYCLGSYTEAVAKGRETIIFLRNKETKNLPYVAVDIQYVKEEKIWKVRQAHGKCNCQITEEDVAFLKRWAKKMKNIDESTIHNHYGALCHA